MGKRKLSHNYYKFAQFKIATLLVFIVTKGKCVYLKFSFVILGLKRI